MGRGQVSEADLDPDRDLTRPTDTSGLPTNQSTMIVTPSLEDSMMPPKRLKD